MAQGRTHYILEWILINRNASEYSFLNRFSLMCRYRASALAAECALLVLSVKIFCCQMDCIVNAFDVNRVENEPFPGADDVLLILALIITVVLFFC